MILGRLLGLGERARMDAPVAQIGAESGFTVQPPALDGRLQRTLAMPWADSLPAAGSAFEISALLDWRTRLAPALHGREAELAGLVGWARGGRKVRLRFVTGPAGAGKSRLAGALAEALDGWQAGIVSLANGGSVPLAGNGLLIVVERPEATPAAFATLLRQAALAEALTLPVRILVLSRRPVAAWRPMIADCGAIELCAAPEMALGPLPPDAAGALFETALARLGDRAGTAVAAPDASAFAAWLGRRPALHGLPLMVQAAAICQATGGGLPPDGAGVMAALARHERAALDREAATRGWSGRGASRLLAVSLLRDTLDPPAIRRLAAPALALGMPPVETAVAAVAALGWWAGDPPPPPDLLAAALLRDAFDEAGPQAPGWVWGSLGDRGVFRPELVARRAEDWAALYDDDANGGLAAIIAAAVADRPDRADRWRALLDAPEGDQRLALVAAAVGRGLLAQPKLPDHTRAAILTGIGNRLWEGGDKAGAIAALREVADIRRRMAHFNPVRFDLPLAQVLATLSNRLGEAGDAAAAVAAISEAVALRRGFAALEPVRYEPELAHCLGLLSSRLAEADQGDAALAAIEEATAIRRRLAQDDPSRWEHDLSASLNALSIRRSDIGDRTGAMAATQEGVALRRRLARGDPARYEPGLAQSLHNLAIRLVEVQDVEGALAAAQEAVSIRRRLAQNAPARFERDLTQSLQNLSHRLVEAGDGGGALTAIRECVAIRRRMAQAAPDRFEGDLTEALLTLSQRLADVQDRAAAVAPIREAIAIRRRLAQVNPARFEPLLAQALHLLAIRLGHLDERIAALAALHEAIAIRTRLAAADPARHGVALAASQELLAEMLAAAPSGT